MIKRKPIRDRFYEAIIKTDTCWNWNKAKNEFGYGKISIGGHHGKMLYAHRVSYEIHIGPIDENLCILHKCDNPSCVNPDHLFLGTHQDNIKDKVSKGRQSSPKGEDHRNVKLTSVQVKQIRELHKLNSYSKSELARMFKVGDSNIHRIVNYKIWKNI